MITDNEIAKFAEYIWDKTNAKYGIKVADDGKSISIISDSSFEPLITASSPEIFYKFVETLEDSAKFSVEEINKLLEKNKQSVDIFVEKDLLTNKLKFNGSFNHPELGLMAATVFMESDQTVNEESISDVIEGFEHDYHRKMTGETSRMKSA